jgi:hypothetical protein
MCDRIDRKRKSHPRHELGRRGKYRYDQHAVQAGVEQRAAARRRIWAFVVLCAACEHAKNLALHVRQRHARFRDHVALWFEQHDPRGAHAIGTAPDAHLEIQ